MDRFNINLFMQLQEWFPTNTLDHPMQFLLPSNLPACLAVQNGLYNQFNFTIHLLYHLTCICRKGGRETLKGDVDYQQLQHPRATRVERPI